MRLCEHPDFEQALIRAAEHFSARRLRPAIIEKDYYVTEALRAIADPAGDKVIFKGGTSLSKGGIESLISAVANQRSLELALSNERPESNVDPGGGGYSRHLPPATPPPQSVARSSTHSTVGTPRVGYPS